ncbi:hypothetical protein F7725_010372 [Dissostichus mawsoni]|uniref:Uncharacterized protein n=1 Tax=Dissostichus mawsoni TaxID=36200 RepID=A0A7J5XNF9_DISMA|nr:hypothetical protein F7725_010372 [Dissostichus mawsoni]
MQGLTGVPLSSKATLVPSELPSQLIRTCLQSSAWIRGRVLEWTLRSLSSSKLHWLDLPFRPETKPTLAESCSFRNSEPSTRRPLGTGLERTGRWMEKCFRRLQYTYEIISTIYLVLSLLSLFIVLFILLFIILILIIILILSCLTLWRRHKDVLAYTQSKGFSLLAERIRRASSAKRISSSFLTLVGGPVGVRAGFWIGGGWLPKTRGTGGAASSHPSYLEAGEGVLFGAGLGAGLGAGEGVLFGAGLGAGDGERLRPRVEDGEAGRCTPGDEDVLSFCSSTEMGH